MRGASLDCEHQHDPTVPRAALGGEGLKEVWPGRIEGEPPAVVFRPEDRRHAVVNAPDELVCRGCDDAEGSDPLAGGRVLPVLPKARETERRSVLHRNSEGCFTFAPLTAIHSKKPSIGTMIAETANASPGASWALSRSRALRVEQQHTAPIASQSI